MQTIFDRVHEISLEKQNIKRKRELPRNQTKSLTCKLIFSYYTMQSSLKLFVKNIIKTEILQFRVCRSH